MDIHSPTPCDFSESGANCQKSVTPPRETKKESTMKSCGIAFVVIGIVLVLIQLKGLQRESNAESIEVTPRATARMLKLETFEPNVEPLIPPISSRLNHTGKWESTTTGGDFDFSHDATASFHGHGDQVCASGCSLSRHPTEKLTLETYRQTVRDAARASSTTLLRADNLAFETLLFFGRQTSKMVERYGAVPLCEAQQAQLMRELRRQHARVSIRVIDQDGVNRSWTDEVRVPLDRRHVFQMETNGVQPLVTSGTVKRVGLDHLWTRL